MYNNILVPVAPDHETSPERSLAVARLLCSDGGKITLLSVIEPVPAYVAQYLPPDQLEQNTEAVRASLEQDAARDGTIAVEVATGNAGSFLTEYAAENGIDCIVIASHRPGLADYFLGSTAARVVRHANCAVHVLR